MRRCLLTLLTVLLFQALPARAQGNAFSTQPHYTQEVLSIAPLRIAYTLHGYGRYAASALPALQLDGNAVLVYAYGNAVAELHAEPLQVAPNQDRYHWHYPAWSAAAAGAPLASIGGATDAGFALSFQQHNNGTWPLQAHFVVTFDRAVDYDPARVHLQVVYLKAGPIAPHIDVFTALP